MIIRKNHHLSCRTKMDQITKGLPMFFKRLIISYCILFSIPHTLTHEIRFSKLDLDMFKLCILKAMHENCQPDSKTAGLAPLCETMKTMINSLNTLSKNGEIKIQEALSP